jgi:hypothetical protein
VAGAGDADSEGSEGEADGAEAASDDEGGDVDGDFGDADDADETMFGTDPDETDDEDEDAPGDQGDEEDDDEGDDDDEDDEDGEDDEDDEDEEEEADEFEPGEAAQLLEETWNSKLERAQAGGEGQGDRLNLGLESVQLRKTALARYNKALEEADTDDGEATAKAMFEVAMDAVIQTLGQYHQNGVQAPMERTELKLADIDLKTQTAEFLETREGEAMAANPKLKAKMSERFERYKAKHGWRLAMRVPFKDYYRMAGGKPVKAGKKAASKKSAASKKKDAALSAARAPKGKRSTATSARKRSGKSTAQKSAEYIRDTEKPFFQVT